METKDQHSDEVDPFGLDGDSGPKETRFEDPFASPAPAQDEAADEPIDEPTADPEEVERLLKDGSLEQRYPKGDHDWRVFTEIRLNRRDWFFKTTVFEDDLAVSAKREDRSAQVIDAEITDDLRRGLAREAAHAHRAQCKTIESRLDESPISHKSHVRFWQVAGLLALLAMSSLAAGWVFISRPLGGDPGGTSGTVDPSLPSGGTGSTDLPPYVSPGSTGTGEAGDSLIPTMPECGSDPATALILAQDALEAGDLRAARSYFDSAASCGSTYALSAAAIFDPAVLWSDRETQESAQYALRYYGIAIRHRQSREEIYQRLAKLLHWVRLNSPGDSELQDTVELYLSFVAIH